MRTFLLAAFVLGACTPQPPTGACHDFYQMPTRDGHYCPNPLHEAAAVAAEDSTVVMCRCPRTEAIPTYRGECEEYERRDEP